MAITRKEINYKDKLLINSYEYLYHRLNNPRTKDSSKERIALAMAKSGISAEQKIEHSGDVTISLAALMAKAGKVDNNAT